MVKLISIKGGGCGIKFSVSVKSNLTLQEYFSRRPNSSIAFIESVWKAVGLRARPALYRN